MNVVDTYKTDLIDRLWNGGLDYTTDPEFLQYLAHTSNKPLYGWMRRHREDERLQDALDVALVEAVESDEERPIHLLVWAGANPHRRVPSVRDWGREDAWSDDSVSSAAELAIVFGRREAFGALRVAAMPGLEEQLRHAHDAQTLRDLATLRPPSDWSEVILNCIRWFSWPGRGRSSWDAREALGFVASSGGKLTSVPAANLRYLRRELLELQDTDSFQWLIRWLKSDKHCDPPIYSNLARTDSMRKKIEALSTGARYVSPSRRQSQAAARRRQAAERKARREEAAAHPRPETAPGGTRRGSDVPT